MRRKRERTKADQNNSSQKRGERCREIGREREREKRQARKQRRERSEERREKDRQGTPIDRTTKLPPCLCKLSGRGVERGIEVPDSRGAAEVATERIEIGIEDHGTH